MSAHFFNSASFCYVGAAFLYLLYLIIRKNVVSFPAQLLTTVGWVIHTIALIFRWYEAGIEHPPWSNLYESLVFFVWGMILIFQIIQYRYMVPLAGSFVLPFAVIGLGVATFGTDQEITPLVPALRSKWIFIHVFMACIAYPSFLMGSVFALLYLMKDRVRIEYFGLSVSFIASIILLSTIGYDMMVHGFLRIVKVALVDGKEVLVQYFPQKGAPLVTEYAEVPSLGYFFLTACTFYVLSFLFYSLSIKRNLPQFKDWAKKLLMGAFVTHGLDIIQFFYFAAARPELSFRGAPFKMAMVILVLFMVVLFFLYERYQESFVKILPKKELLDSLSFKANMFGLPMVTLLLVTGGIWAHSAWGRFWGWDPKETWALITWFIYVIYVHSRIVSGWSGRKPAVISIIGFFVVMFTYLGVNVLLSGLHSYGNPNPQS